MHPNARLLFLKYALPYFKPSHRVLEISPDAVPSSLQQAAGVAREQWITTELHGRPGIDRVMPGEYEFPFAEGEFDVVLSANVIEHVRKIWRWMPECARVCKRGGVVITINPVSWPYHEYPIDCWRMYPEGARALSEDSGLAVELSTFECLEVPPGTWCLPGHTWSARKQKIFRFFRLPVQGAFDTLTIARKP